MILEGRTEGYLCLARQCGWMLKSDWSIGVHCFRSSIVCYLMMWGYHTTVTYNYELSSIMSEFVICSFVYFRHHHILCLYNLDLLKLLYRDLGERKC